MTYGRFNQALRLGAHLGRCARHMAIDTAAGTRRSFPRTIADLDPDRLSALIGARVTGVAVIDGADGTSSRARLKLTGDGVPESVFAKVSASTAEIRMLGELARLGETEVRFYRHLAPDLGAGVPHSYGAGYDAMTGRYVVVLEDMATRPCEFPDTLHPLGPDRMALLVELLARVHATYWGRLPETRSDGGRLGWLWSASEDPTTVLTLSVMKLAMRKLAGRTSVPFETGRYVMENFAAATALVDAGGHTVLHGDAHPGNTFFRDGKAGLLDWQVVRRGHPSRDLAYAMILGMEPAERQAVQQDLLATYRAALIAAGGPEFGDDELWVRYRQAGTYAYVSALSTAGLGGMQDDGIAFEGLRRAVTALDDLETVDALKMAM